MRRSEKGRAQQNENKPDFSAIWIVVNGYSWTPPFGLLSPKQPTQTAPRTPMFAAGPSARSTQ